MAEISGLKEEKVRRVASPHPCALRRKSWDQERFFLRRYAFPRFESITRVLGTGVAHLRKWANREETGRQVRSWGVGTPGLRAHQYIRGNFPARSGPGTLTVSGAESAVSHIIPGDGRNPDALGRAGPRGWDPGRAAGGMGHAGPATRTSRTTGVTERRPLVSRPGPPPSARASGQAACRTDAQRLVISLPSVPKLRRGLSPRLRRLEGSVFS